MLRHRVVDLDQQVAVGIPGESLDAEGGLKLDAPLGASARMQNAGALAAESAATTWAARLNMGGKVERCPTAASGRGLEATGSLSFMSQWLADGRDS